MFTKIVGFGDSFMYGDELVDPNLPESADLHYTSELNRQYRERYCYLGLLGEHYGVSTQNYGVPGGSLQSTMLNFLWWLQHDPGRDQCLVLICLTHPSRTSFFNADQSQPLHQEPPASRLTHTSCTHMSTQFRELFRHYMAYADCEESHYYNYLQAVMLFDGQAARHGFPLIQFPWISGNRELTAPTLIWNQGLVRQFDEITQYQRREYYQPNCHPNEKGHELIRDLLIPNIDRVTLAG